MEKLLLIMIKREKKIRSEKDADLRTKRRAELHHPDFSSHFGLIR